MKQIYHITYYNSVLNRIIRIPLYFDNKLSTLNLNFFDYGIKKIQIEYILYKQFYKNN